MKSYGLFLLTLFIPAWSSAAGFDYDYVDLGHTHISPENGQDASGPFVDLSYTILDGVQFRGGYERLDIATSPADITAKDYSLGFTGETSLSAATDLYTDLLYLNDHQTSTTGGVGSSSTDDGYRIAIGLRHHAWQHLELDGYLAHNYLSAGSNELGVGALFDITSWLALGAGYAHDSLHANTATLRVRLIF